MANLYDQAQAFRADLLRDERRAARRMFDVYSAAYKRITLERQAVLAVIADKRAAGIPDSDIPALLYREGRLQVLQAKVVDELTRFAKQADVIVGGAIDLARVAGDEHAAALMQLALPEGITVAPSGERVPGGLRVTPVVPEEVGLARDAAQQVAAFTQSNAPVGQLFAEFGPQAAKSLTDALTSGIIAGKNPRVIAADMRQALGGNLTRALTIARTETMRAYREASRAAYNANSDVLAGWVWTADLSNRTCPACWAQHGTVHPLDEVMATHPRCRCSMVPKTKSWRELGFGEQPEGVNIEPGPAVFRRLPEADQRRILGPSKYDAYKRREITLPDIVAKRDSPRWGPSTAEAGLTEAKDNAALRKATGGIPPPTTAVPDVVLPPAPEYAPGAVLPSESLDLFIGKSASTRKAADEIANAVDALDRLLRVPAGKNQGGKLPVKYSSAKKTVGQYRRGQNYRGDFIESEMRVASSAADDADAVFLHEYGHYMDSELLGTDTFATLSMSEDLAGWREAISSSRSVQDVASNYRRKDANYFLSADELWARSFAQWVATRIGDRGLLARVRGSWTFYEKRYGGINPQWDDDDFAPIAKAIDDLMRKRGWLV